MLIVGRRAIPWVLERIAGTGSRELFTLAVLAIALGVAFGSAELFGVSFALGAFFAGMLLNESEFSHQAAQDSLPMRDAFAVLFFVSVGMLFDPRILIEHPLQVLATTLIIVFGKSVAAYAIVRAFGHPNATALTISDQPGADRRVRLHHRRARPVAEDPAQGRPRPGAGRRADHRSCSTRSCSWCWIAGSGARTRAIPPTTPPEPDVVPLDIGGHAIVVGYGRVGSQLAQLLQRARRAAGGDRGRRRPGGAGPRQRLARDPRQRRQSAG